MRYLVIPAALLFAATQDIPEDTLPQQLSTDAPQGLEGEFEGVEFGSEEQAALGRRLFFDPVLSVDRSIACASCHDPAHGFADTQAKSEGVHGRRTLRNAPTLYNRVLGEAFMWDGKAATLEEQVLQPISNELEMDLAVGEAVARLAADNSYRAEFKAAFDGHPSEELLAKALTAFVARLLYGDSPVDRFRDGEHDALTPEERGGMWFFESRGNCWKCHAGQNFSDEDFHTTGVGLDEQKLEDGRFAVTGDDADRGAFKTPTLRGLTETGPYMHDGSLATLEEVVEFYRKGPAEGVHHDPDFAPLDMSEKDAANLAAFLRALSRR
jgi:cytochrome c peroxidase